MKLATGEMVLLFGEERYQEVIYKIAEHFGLVRPLDPVINIAENNLLGEGSDGVLAAQIWGPQSVYEWSNLYGFQMVIRGAYFYDNSLGPYRIYR